MLQNTVLKNAVKLRGKVTIYVPSTTDVNKKIDNKIYVEECATIMHECFGGATSTPAVGFWVGKDGIVREDTTLVFSYCNQSDLEKSIDRVVDYCEKLKIDLRQESVALEINGEMYLL